MALAFNGTTDYLTATEPTYGAAGSWLCWFKSPSFSQFAKIFDTGGSNRSYIQVSDGERQMDFVVGGASVFGVQFLFFEYDTWTLSTITWDNGGASPYATWYKNESVFDTRTSTFTVTSPTDTLYIGRRLTAANYWNGDMAHLARFNRALTAEEVAGVYRGGSIAALRPTTYWPLNGAVGAAALSPDLGGSADNATAQTSIAAATTAPIQGRYVAAPAFWAIPQAGAAASVVPVLQASLKRRRSA